MQRRGFLAGSSAVSALGVSRGVAAQRPDARVLRFVPQSDLTVLDPHWTTAYVTRNHALAVFDTLFGSDGSGRATPQMLAGYAVGDDGRQWTLTLRDGLRFHDGEPVRARDCVASIRRWGARDAYGQALLAATDELSAADDRTVTFRLRRPFVRLPDALGKVASYLPAIMPERLANTDPFKQVTEMVGSGPFRFLAGERVPGARVVYQRFDGYVPREGSVPDMTAGPKVATVERVEWLAIPDAATAAAALQSGEVDWWESPAADLLPLLGQDRNVRLDVIDPTGAMPMMRMNHLTPPFNNPAVRRAVLMATNQAEYMQAYVGTDDRLWRAGVGVFPPGTELASDAGMEALAHPDAGKAKAALRAAGYGGEKVVLMAATDLGNSRALADVGADLLRRLGMDVDYQLMDWGTLNQRRVKKEPAAQGGWSVFYTQWAGLDLLNPAGNLALRGNGADAWLGWPTSPRLEALRDAWLQTADPAAGKAIAADIQEQAFVDVPFIPLGQMVLPTAYRTTLSGVPRGAPVFWNLRKTA